MFSGSRVRDRHTLELRLAFGLLVTLLFGVGYLALSRMHRVDAGLNEIAREQWDTLRLANEALARSTQNSRITMQVFLVKDQAEIQSLLQARADNSREISRLIQKLKPKCNTEEETNLLAAVEQKRAPYVASYLRALHLLVDEHRPSAARAAMAQETTPALFAYHAAWQSLVQSQMDEVDQTSRAGRSQLRNAYRAVMLLVVLCVCIAIVIGGFVSHRIGREMMARLRAEMELRELNANLEQRVEVRNQELLAANARLTNEVAERQATENRLHLQAAALEAAANAIVITDVTGRIQWVNSAFTALTGYSRDEACGNYPRVLKSGKHDRSLYETLWKTILAGHVWHGQLVNRRKDGTLYDEEMTITPVRAGDGQITRFIAIKRDITASKAAQEAVRSAEEKYRTIFENAVVGIFQATPDGRLLTVNSALARMLGYESAKQMMEELDGSARRLFTKGESFRETLQLIGKQGILNDFEMQLACKDGREKWVSANACTVYDSTGKIVRHEGTVQDISKRKEAEDQVRLLAFYDAVTGLPNRTLLQDRLSQALSSAQRRREKLAVLFFDLDHFKTINDSLGHSVGDLVLQAVAERLKKFARAQDTVARLGGDEFVVVLNAVEEVGDAAVAANRIVKAIDSPFSIDGRLLNISCSLGVSIFPEHGTDGETLIRNADAAMYAAKENGRNNCRFFTQEMNRVALERLNLENDLRLALEKEEFVLHYQPQVDLESGDVIGAEALLRWNHPERGLISPARFIPPAENSGMIVSLGEWVLRTTCAEAQNWHQAGRPPLPVAVNVSAVQFRHDSFVSVVENTLRGTGMDPALLELELTEGLLLSNNETTHSNLTRLSALGVRLSIDDFGTGYSCLSYLKQLPVYKLKIDRSFVRAMTSNADDAAITKTIIDMARTLRLKVIAEGVETKEQLDLLRRLRCDEGQGYYFGRPMPALEFRNLSRRGSKTVRLGAIEELEVVQGSHTA